MRNAIHVCLLGTALLGAAGTAFAAGENAAALLASARAAAGKGDYAASAEKYQRLYEKNPGHDEYLLSWARTESWQGNLDKAAGLFEQYVERHPADKEALLGYAYTQSWRGDYAHALDLLGLYREEAGATAEYIEAKALFLAYAGRPDESLALTAGPTRTDGQLMSRVIAFKEAGRAREALEALDKFRKAKPAGDKTAAGLEKSVRAPLRSALQGDVSFSSDSDTVRAFAASLEGKYAVDPDFHLRAGVEDGFLRADIGSGLEAISGRARIDRRTVWVGADYAAIRDLRLQGRLGQADADGADGTLIYRAAAALRASDALSLGASIDRDFHAVSPRALSLDVKRTDNQLSATWRPAPAYTVEAGAGYAFFSDDNERWNVSIAPRRSFLRTEDVNLDLGVYARWFGFDKDLANGYYDPAHYRQFLLTAHAYVKLSDDAGLSLVIAPGLQRDDDFDSYKRSGNYAAEATFGIDGDWTLKLRAGFVDGRGVRSDSYQQRAAGLNLTRRF